MPRKQVRHSIIKGILPKMQLRASDALSGSVPTLRRIASDNRTGVYRTFYDDTNTLVFQSYVTTSLNHGGIQFPTGLPSGSVFLERYTLSGTLVADENLSSSLSAQGVLRLGVGDQFANIVVPGQEFQPFRDDKNYGVDGKSVLSGATQDSFWATGSNVGQVGEGFSQPLWSKTKLEIDLSVAGTSNPLGVYNDDTSNINYPMMYYNNVTKTYEGIGTGKNWQTYISGNTTTLSQLLEEQCVGFSFSIDNGGNPLGRDSNNSSFLGYGIPISNFGFPYHAKFQPTSSNLIPLSGVLTAPFLVEKIVLEFSGALAMNSTAFKTATNSSLSTFFILNKRKPFGASITNFQNVFWRNEGTTTLNTLVTGVQIPQAFNGVQNEPAIMDIVSWMQVSAITPAGISVTSGSAYLARELTFLSASNGEWSGRFLMSGTVKNPIATVTSVNSVVWTRDPSLTQTFAFGQSRASSTRHGLSNANGRDFLNTIELKPVLLSDSIDTIPINLFTGYSKVNPYLLYPTDNLVAGWQVPWSRIMNQDGTAAWQYTKSGPQLTFSGSAKLIIYGSQLERNTEFHDTLNQLLGSRGVHEVIG